MSLHRLHASMSPVLPIDLYSCLLCGCFPSQARLVKFVAVLDAAMTPARVEAALDSLEVLMTDDRLTR